MSTRCTTHFLYHDETKPVAIIYRHSDGYPTGAGKDIYTFLRRCQSLHDTRFNDPSYLAARYVVFLSEMFNSSYDDKPKADRLDFISVGILDQDAGDIDYRYEIICSNDSKRLPIVSCYEVAHGGDALIAIPDEQAYVALEQSA